VAALHLQRWLRLHEDEIGSLEVLAASAVEDLSAVGIQRPKRSGHLHADGITFYLIRYLPINLRGPLSNEDLDAGHAIALPDPGPDYARDRHPRGRVRLLDLLDRHGRHLAIRYWFTLTRTLVRARWQDRKVESNEQAAGNRLPESGEPRHVGRGD